MDRLNEKVAQAYVRRFCEIPTEGSECCKTEKIKYAIVSLLSQGEKLVLIFILAFCVGMLKESLIVLITLLLTRTYLGGTHKGGFISCLLHTTSVFAAAVFFGNYAGRVQSAIYIVFTVYFIMIICLSPIPSQAKPHFSKKRKRVIRKNAMKAMLVLVLLCGVLKNDVVYIVATLFLVEVDAMFAVLRLEVRKLEKTNRLHQ
jgi:accessory gene regulator B